MKFMNTWDIDEARQRWQHHAVLGRATRTLANLRDAADANSDGWCYWPKPARAARLLMELIEGDGSWQARMGERTTATDEQLRKAYAPLKAFRTASGLQFEIE
jgi:hypothetical protein